MARVRMTENQIILGLVGGTLEEQFELAADAVGHRHGSRGQSRLRHLELATDFHSRRSMSRSTCAWAARVSVAGVCRQTGVVAASSSASSSAATAEGS